MTAGEGLADSILYLVDTISHLREPSHAPACPTPGCPSHRPRPALHPPRLAQRHRQVSARRCAQGHPRRPGRRRTGRPARPWRRRESDPPLPTRTLRRLDRRTGRTPPTDAGGRLRRELQHQRLERSRRLPSATACGPGPRCWRCPRGACPAGSSTTASRSPGCP